MAQCKTTTPKLRTVEWISAEEEPKTTKEVSSQSPIEFPLTVTIRDYYGQSVYLDFMDVFVTTVSSSYHYGPLHPQ